MGVIGSWAYGDWGRGGVFRFALCLRRWTKALRTTMASNEMKAKISHAAKMLSKVKRTKEDTAGEKKGKENRVRGKRPGNY